MSEPQRRTKKDEGLLAPLAPVAARRTRLVVVTGIDEDLDRHVGAAVRELGLFGGADPECDVASREGVLASVNERLLARLGATLASSAERLEVAEPAELAELAEDARAALADELDRGPSIITGAAFAPLLPFWQGLGLAEIWTVLCVPSVEGFDRRSVATSRHRVSALAAYERYHRVALDHLEQNPTFVLADAKLTKDPAGVLSELVAFCAPDDRFARDAVGRVAAELSARARANDESRGSESPVIGPLLELDQKLAALSGPHERLAPGELGEESPWSSAIVELERDLGHLTNALLWASHQIEPVLRAEARDEIVGRHHGEAQEEEDEDDDDDDPSQFDEPNVGIPYPLNASEDRRGYHRWLIAHRQPVTVGGPSDPPRRRARTRAPLRVGNEPLISVLVPVWKTPLWALERCVSSVLNQRFSNWELCICDDASHDADLTSYLRGLRRVDRRIRVCALAENGGISAATNAALELARGRYVAFLDHDDELTPDALSEVSAAIAAAPDAEVLYSDEDKIDAAGERFDPLFKPEWSPDLLMSFAYLCHLTVVRRDLVVELGGLRSQFDGSQDYDLSLRTTERAGHIVHIPRILYHWRTLPGSAATDSPTAVAKPWAYEAGRRALEDALLRRGEAGEVTLVGNYPGRYAVRRRHAAEPLVSIIVPFRDEPRLLATCASSLRSDPGYANIEFVLVDNGSQLPETMALLDRLAGEPGVRLVNAPGPFNWAAINNAAVGEAAGEVLLFANNDIEARVPRWLDAMLSHALRPEVGAVGARLLYPDGAIQHAGVVIGLGGIAGHVLRGLPGEHPGYNSMAIATRNCSVVTGACMMTRREVFESIGGFDELLPVAFNDVDFCLKLREKGYLVVYTPEAEFVHHESRSRGHTDDLTESRRIVRRWKHAIAAGDPYMNVHLSHWRYWCPLSTAQEDDRWKNYLETSVLTRASSSST